MAGKALSVGSLRIKPARAISSEPILPSPMSGEFTYRRKVGEKRSRQEVDASIDELISEIELHPTKRSRQVASQSDWFHNYKPILTEVDQPKVISMAQQPLRTLHQIDNNILRTQVAKSQELLKRTQTRKKVVPTSPAPSSPAPSTEEKKSAAERKKAQLDRQRRAKRALQILEDRPQLKKPARKTTTTRTRKGKTTLKVAKEPTIVDTFPYEGLKVLDRIYVGGVNVASNKELLDQRNIRIIVNATKELPNYFAEEVPASNKENGPANLSDSASSVEAEESKEESGEYFYHKISLTDSTDSPLINYFDNAADFIHQHLEDPAHHSVLVHCQMGQSRSPSVIIAYLMKKRQWTLAKAWAHFEKVHPSLKVNEGFKLQLMQYEKKVTGNSTHDFYKKRVSRPPSRYQAKNLR